MSSPLIAATAVTVGRTHCGRGRRRRSRVVVAVIIALSLSPHGCRRVVIIAIATAAIITVSRWRGLGTTGSVGQYVGEGVDVVVWREWYGSWPRDQGWPECTRGEGAAAVLWLPLRACGAKWVGQRRGGQVNCTRKAGVAHGGCWFVQRGGLQDIGGHNTAAVPLRCPTTVHITKTGHQYTHAANAYTANSATHKPKELPWHPLSTPPPRQWRHDDNGDDRDEVMTTRLQGNGDDHDHNGDSGGGGHDDEGGRDDDSDKAAAGLA
ncbi:hypothetical protein BJY52DRAFT_1420849 [Lactarius psammicola]|nr:hypothetical protein BJY52DRAFT_1420849 [Lactarius psammicola]